jgi:hypothetical protein
MTYRSSYQYDVFLSYIHSENLGPWIKDDFHRTFTHYLDLELLSSRLFYDDRDIGIGTVIEERVRNGLANSICIVPLLVPNYFISSWCPRELYTMVQRQEYLRRENPDREYRLIIPIVLGDGRYFPCWYKKLGLRFFDLKDYTMPGINTGGNTPLREEFHKKIREIVQAIVSCVEDAPPWQSQWAGATLIDPPLCQGNDPNSYRPTLR